MKCTYQEPQCIYLHNGECDISTCFDEYDIAEGTPYPSEEVKEYWEDLLGVQLSDTVYPRKCGVI